MFNVFREDVVCLGFNDDDFIQEYDLLFRCEWEEIFKVFLYLQGKILKFDDNSVYQKFIEIVELYEQ